MARQAKIEYLNGTMPTFNGETCKLKYKGRIYNVRAHSDDDAGLPFEENDGHGPVRKVSTRHGRGYDTEKRPGEVCLNDPDSNAYQYLYDKQAAQKQALAESWGMKESPPNLTRKQYAELAVQADISYCSAWLAGDYWYIGLTLTSANGEFEDSLWGIESGYDSEHAESVLRDMLDEMHHSREKADQLHAQQTVGCIPVFAGFADEVKA